MQEPLSNDSIQYHFFSHFIYFNRVCGKDYPKDTVIVHDFAKGVFVPSIGHFVMKLETYLRIAKIPYEVSLSFVLFDLILYVPSTIFQLQVNRDGSSWVEPVHVLS